MRSLLTYLECADCGNHFDPDRIHTFCPTCQAPLLARYDLDKGKAALDRDEFRTRPVGMWRWEELLPVRDPANFVSLGEGDTPLLLTQRLGAAVGLERVYVKDESLNPTFSFKARGLGAAISKAKELGIEKVIIPTAGNAGGAMAAYAARAGMRAHIFMPNDTPVANIEESRIAGAEVTLIEGLISEAAGMAGEKAKAENWFDVSTFKEPYRVEGKKIMGYELAETFGWELPEVIVYPTGGGTGLIGMWKAFDEMAAMGWLDSERRPRMVVVQADGCAPVVRAFEAGADFCDFWTGAHTIASGLRVPKSFADQLIMLTLYASGGTAVAVSDQAILEAQRELAVAEGIFAAPEGAATFAALKVLAADGWVGAEERVVLFNTGAGLKYI
ncbi:MAG TPA: threonine synthase [Anaerolineales bacterium]|nr:threonine synthase [Anaerolineales bacterium]